MTSDWLHVNLESNVLKNALIAEFTVEL